MEPEVSLCTCNCYEARYFISLTLIICAFSFLLYKYCLRCFQLEASKCSESFCFQSVLTFIITGIPHEVHWPVCFKTIVSCEDDSFQTQRYPCVARYFTFVTNSEDRQTTLAATHNSTIWVSVLLNAFIFLWGGGGRGRVNGSCSGPRIPV